MLSKFDEIRNIKDDLESFLDGDWEFFIDLRDDIIPELQSLFDRITSEDIANEFDLTIQEVNEEFEE